MKTAGAKVSHHHTLSEITCLKWSCFVFNVLFLAFFCFTLTFSYFILSTLPPSFSHQVESNPFPFNYVANYTVSTEVASMEFRTENGTQIPISGLDDSLAITVAINNGSSGAEVGPDGSGTGGVPTAGAVNISHCDSVIVRVSTGNTNRQAGLFVQLNFTSLEGELSLSSHTIYYKMYSVQ